MLCKSWSFPALPIVLLLAILAHASPAGAFSGPGSGTDADPYRISTIGHLDEGVSDLGMVVTASWH